MFNAAVDERVKEALKGETPKGDSGKTPTITKDGIMKIKDPVERQRKIAENIQLFE